MGFGVWGEEFAGVHNSKGIRWGGDIQVHALVLVGGTSDVG
jgi:hypothetical protein